MIDRMCALSTQTVVVLAGIAFTAGLAIGAGSSADAHTATAYFTKTWDADPYYAFGQLNAPFNTSEAKYAIHSGDDPWNSVYGSSLDFQWSGNENGHVFWQGTSCSTAPSNGLWIMTDDLGSLAIENTCFEGGAIIKSTIRFDNVGPSWYTGVSTSVPSGESDVRSVSVHEFGHAAGFAGHFAGTPDCSGSSRQTMCANVPSGTSYIRTLESHDKHTIASAYPVN